MLECCCLPVHLVLLGPCMYYDAVLHIVSLHCSFVFTYPLLQCSSCFSHVDTLAFDAWYIPGTRLLSSSTLVGSHLLAPRLPRGFPSIWRLSWCKGACTSSPLSCWHLSHMISGGTGGVVCSCSSVQVEEWGGCGWFLRVWFTICAEPPPSQCHTSSTVTFTYYINDFSLVMSVVYTSWERSMDQNILDVDCWWTPAAALSLNNFPFIVSTRCISFKFIVTIAKFQCNNVQHIFNFNVHHCTEYISIMCILYCCCLCVVQSGTVDPTY